MTEEKKLFLRMADLTELVGLSRSTLNRLINEDPNFPRPVKLTPFGRAIGFCPKEIAAWCN
ncbi:MAG: AlpA family phage regulatory protein, partial [Deltaproteobacteria bacterium]|nr:AlpA family phage regulatory protein [Deltaproteobacteria bacterium]